MEACEPLKEYAWLVDAIRGHEKISHDIEAAVDAAIYEMPDDFLIKKFLLKNKAEVKGMFLTEYDQEKVLAYERLEVEEQTNERVATDMLMEKNIHCRTLGKLADFQKMQFLIWQIHLELRQYKISYEQNLRILPHKHSKAKC